MDFHIQPKPKKPRLRPPLQQHQVKLWLVHDGPGRGCMAETPDAAYHAWKKQHDFEQSRRRQ